MMIELGIRSKRCRTGDARLQSISALRSKVKMHIGLFNH